MILPGQPQRKMTFDTFGMDNVFVIWTDGYSVPVFHSQLDLFDTLILILHDIIEYSNIRPTSPPQTFTPQIRRSPHLHG